MASRPGSVKSPKTTLKLGEDGGKMTSGVAKAKVSEGVHMAWEPLDERAIPLVGSGPCIISCQFSNCKVGHAFKCNLCTLVCDCKMCTLEDVCGCHPHCEYTQGLTDLNGFSWQLFCLDFRYSVCFGNNAVPCMLNFLGLTCCYKFKCISPLACFATVKSLNDRLEPMEVVNVSGAPATPVKGKGAAPAATALVKV